MNAIKFGVGVTALSFGGVLLSYGIGQGLIFLFKMFGWLGFAFGGLRIVWHYRWRLSSEV